MKIAWIRMTMVLQLIGLSAAAQASPSGFDVTQISSECCFSQQILSTAQKAEAFCRQHPHQVLDAQAKDPCQLEKDAVQQYASEYALATDNRGTCEDDCHPSSINN